MSEDKTPCVGPVKKLCDKPAQYKVMLANTPGGFSMCKGCAEKTFHAGRGGATVTSIVMFTSEIPGPI